MKIAARARKERKVTPKNQAELDRAHALADFHEAGNANADMTGEGNSRSPERQQVWQKPLSNTASFTNPRAVETLNAPIQGSEPNDSFNRSLNASQTTVNGGHAECSTAPGAGKISAFGAAAAEAMGDVNAKAQTDRRNAYKSPLAMTKEELGYDPRSHH
jgi:hypothetical protein